MRECSARARDGGPPRQLTESEIDQEVSEALKFRPELNELVFATTAPNDAAVQDHVHSITAKHEEEGLFSVHVYWWPEITRRLTRHEDLVRKHFNYTQLGDIEEKLDALSEQSSQATAFRASSGLVNREIRAQRDRLRKARFFGGFDQLDAAEKLANRVMNGDLQEGSSEEKATTLCWCARLLAYERTERAEELLSRAKTLDARDEIAAVVDAFLVAAKGNRELALASLAQLNTPHARSAALFVVRHGQEASEGPKWLAQVGYVAADLDPDGKFQCLAQFIEVGDWQTALTIAADLHEQDFQNAPVLHFAAAVAHVVQAVPDEYRPLVTQQVPFEVDSFPLATTSEMLTYCRAAKRHFEQCSLAAEQLGLKSAANIAADYALWLGLRDPQSHTAALDELRESISDGRHALRRLNYAIRFGLPVEFDETSKEIDRQTALTGGKSSDAALARLALAFRLSTEKAVADYIAQHREQLIEHLDSTSIARLEIEMLSRSGQVALAENRLEELKGDGLDHRIESSLARILSEAKGSDPVAARIEEYENDSSLSNLANLVDLLESRASWEQMVHYSRLQLEAAPSVASAQKFARALNELGRQSEIYTLLSDYPEFVGQSEFLKSVWCVSLFQRGDLQSASEALDELRTSHDRPDYRDMAVQLAIASGDWDSLLTYVEAEWHNREQRSAKELVRVAQLAQFVGSPRTRELTRGAVSKASEDAQVLLAAFGIATDGGWEEDDEVAKWFGAAIEHSDESGPVQRLSLSDLIDRTPAWNKREEGIWQALRKGEVPIFGAAAAINRTLCDSFLIPSLANIQEPDARKRSHVFAYSGAIVRAVPQMRRIALDATSLLTFSILGVTEKVIESFDEIAIPHATLGWLFEEKQRILFHQPSRVRAATELRALLQDGQLQRFAPTVAVDADLSAEVGLELASLLTEAKRDADSAGRQRLVVRSCPVHKIGSLMNETADLSAYSDHLCSCTTLIEKLWQKGQLTTSQRDKSLLYLNRNEHPWPSEPAISNDAVLYLDSLAVNYLQHVGVLSKLKQAGFEAFVSRDESQELSALLRYDSIARKADEIVEGLRSILADGISSKKIRLGELPSAEGDQDANRFRMHPTVSIMDVAQSVDAVVVDDRFINQHVNLDSGAALAPIITSVEVLDALAINGSINLNELLEHRTTLRKCGFTFMAQKSDEIVEHLQAAEIVDEVLQETADLRSIREIALQNRMSAALVLPKEAPWVAEFQRSIADALRAQWSDTVDTESARARSNWLLELLDVRGWSQSSGFEGGQALAQSGHFTLVLSLLRSPPKAKKQFVAAYWRWLEETVLDPLRENDPATFEQILQAAEATIAHVVDLNDNESSDAG